MSETNSMTKKKPWPWVWTGVVAVLAAVVAPLAVSALQPHVEIASGRLGSQLDVTVQDQSSCNFVAPSESSGTIDPEVIGMTPAEFGRPNCDENIAAIDGAHNNIVLEVVMEPTNDNAVVFTDITIDIRDQTPTTGSAYYQPAGIGGGATTLTAQVDVEAPAPVQEITVYGSDGTESKYPSLEEALPRPMATASDPLVVILSLYGSTNYTVFDVVLHWQSGTTIGQSVLDNGGKGYEVAGASGLPNFEGFDGTWKPASQ
jgi:hypothetical protein